MNKPASSRKRGFFRREHGGILALFCFASLAIHLGAGFTSRSFDFNLPKTMPTPPPAEVEIALAPAPAPAKPAAPMPQVFAPAPAKPKPAAPKVRPAAAPKTRPAPRLKPAPKEASAKPVIKETPKPALPKLEKPESAEIKNANKSAAPLPLGVASGDRNLTQTTPRPQPAPSISQAPRVDETPKPTPRPPPVPLVSATPRPRVTPPVAAPPLIVPGVSEDTFSPAPPLIAAARPTPNPMPTPVPAPAPDPSPSAKPIVALPAPVASRPPLGPFGITRGVPFGDRLGVPKGDPNGGGVGYKNPYRLSLQPENTDNTPPVHIVYVIDTSTSMADDGKIQKARDALQKALSELRTDDTFNIVPFSDRARTVFRKMSKVNNSTVASANTNIDFLEPDGETNLSDAIDLALQQNEVSHIFVMSDGVPTRGIIEFPELLAHVRQRNTKNVHIITLALGLGEKFPGIALLRALADQNDGKFDYINLRGR